MAKRIVEHARICRTSGQILHTFCPENENRQKSNKINSLTAVLLSRNLTKLVYAFQIQVHTQTHIHTKNKNVRYETYRGITQQGDVTLRC